MIGRFKREELEAFERAVDGDFSEFLTLADEPLPPYLHPIVMGTTYCGLKLWAMKTPDGWLRGISKPLAPKPMLG